jgi:hypothetical protein
MLKKQNARKYYVLLTKEPPGKNKQASFEL